MAEKKKQSKPSFEEALSSLDALVKGLEQGDAPLSELVESYEKGQSLLRICRERLQDAELRVKMVIKDGTELAESEATEAQTS